MSRVPRPPRSRSVLTAGRQAEARPTTEVACLTLANSFAKLELSPPNSATNAVCTMPRVLGDYEWRIESMLANGRCTWHSRSLSLLLRHHIRVPSLWLWLVLLDAFVGAGASRSVVVSYEQGAPLS